jgi:hypothetical protein
LAAAPAFAQQVLLDPRSCPYVIRVLDARMVGGKLVIVEDTAATARTTARRTPATYRRFGNKNISRSTAAAQFAARLPDPAYAADTPVSPVQPAVSRVHLRAVQNRSGGKLGREPTN